MGINTPSNNLNVKKFYEKWWTIDQLVDSFWTTIPDSCRKSVEKRNLNALENVIKTFDLFQKSRNKKLSECIKECGMSNFSEDLKLCHRMVLLQSFCKEKEEHSSKKMIDNDQLNFLDRSLIDIMWTNNLSNRQIIEEIRDGIGHHKYICLPDWIYIDNPIWPKHRINFKATVKRELIESIVNNIYFCIQRTYINDVDCWNVDFNEGFDQNKEKIKLCRYIAKEKGDYAQIMALASYSIFQDYFKSENFEKIERELTPKEAQHLSNFFDNHVFWENELKSSLSYKDSWSFAFLFNFLSAFKNRDWTYEEFIKDNKIKESLNQRSLKTKPHPECFWNFIDSRVMEYKKNQLPTYEELIDILTTSIARIFSDNQGLLQKKTEDRKTLVFKIIEKEIKKYLSDYMHSDKYYKKRKKEIEHEKLYNENFRNDLISKKVEGVKIRDKEELEKYNWTIFYELDSSKFNIINIRNEENIKGIEGGDWTMIYGKMEWENGFPELYFPKNIETTHERMQRMEQADKKRAVEEGRIDDVDVSEYKDEINYWDNLSNTEKEAYLDKTKESLMGLFDRVYSEINYNEILLSLHLDGISNNLKALYISNYYTNDPSLVPLWNVANIPEREHIRNAFSHINYTSLPWTNEILLKDPSRRKDSSDREKIYDLQKLYERCLRKTNNRFGS